MTQRKPEAVAWMRQNSQYEFVATGEVTPLATIHKSVSQKIPSNIRKALTDSALYELRLYVEAARRMMIERKMLSVIIDFFTVNGAGEPRQQCFHTDPSMIPELDADCLFIRVTTSGEVMPLFGLKSTPEQRAMMQKSFSRQGGADREQ